MRNLNTYILINGHLEISNSEIKINYNIKKYYTSSFKIITSILLIVNFKDKIINFDINAWYTYFKFFILSFAILFVVANFYNLIFKRIWVNKIQLNDLIKIEIEDDEKDEELDEDSKIELTLIKSNGRKKIIELKKKNNELNQFLDELKKRNSRIEIKHLKSEK